MKKTDQIIVKLTPREKEVLQKEAEKAGMTMSAFVLLCVRSFTDGIRFEKKTMHNRRIIE